MKDIEIILKENPDIKLESEKCNLWFKSANKEYELLFTGSKEDCEVEYELRECDSIHNEILLNRIRDTWEDPLTGMGYITFENDTTLSYSLARTNEEKVS